MVPTIDFRLYKVPMELCALELHLGLIERHIDRGQQEMPAELENKTRERSLDETDWGLLSQELRFQHHFVEPRLLRCTFLAALFAVYESAVTEVAELIRRKQAGQTNTVRSRRNRNFPDWAKNYYKECLNFELSKNDNRCERLRLLSDLRNAIVHRNGRLDMVRKRDKILKNEGIRSGTPPTLCDSGYAGGTGSVAPARTAAAAGMNEEVRCRSSNRGR